MSRFGDDWLEQPTAHLRWRKKPSGFIVGAELRATVNVLEQMWELCGRDEMKIEWREVPTVDHDAAKDE